FMKTPEAAAELASLCVRLAADWDRPALAAVTDMSQPLGTAIGNALDVAESVRVLTGEESGPLRDLAVRFAAAALGALAGVDAAVGIVFRAKIGDRLTRGDPIGEVHARDEDAAALAVERSLRALTVAGERVAPPPLLHDWYPSDHS